MRPSASLTLYPASPHATLGTRGEARGTWGPGGRGRFLTRGRGRGGSRASRARLRLDRAAGEARSAPGPAYSPDGAARARGVCNTGDPGEHSPPPRRRPRWEARRDGPAASLPRLLSPSYKYRLGPHSPPPTPGALRKVRRQRTPQPERKGDGAAQVTAMAPAVRQPPQLEAWPPAAPALPLPPLPPAPRADSSPRAARAAQSPPRPGPPLQSRRLQAGDHLGSGGGGGGGGGRLPLACQQQSLRPGGIRRVLIKSTILRGTNEVPRWNSLKRTANFLTQSQVIEHPFCLYQLVLWRWGGKRPPARIEVLTLTLSLPGLTHTHSCKYIHIRIHIYKHAHIHTYLEMDKYMYTCIYIYTHIYKHTHTLTHAHVCAHIYQKHTHV